MAGASEVRVYQVTCPPGTAIAAPQITGLVMPSRTVNSIRVRIPPGPNGVMGFAIGSAGVPIIPTGAAQFIVASDEVIDWTLIDQINSGAWQVQMYNTGIFAHTIYLQFDVEVPDAADDNAAVTQLPVDAITPPAATVTPVPTVTAPTLPAVT